MKKVLWFSRHEMTEAQRKALGEVEINQIDRTIRRADELKQEIDESDIIAIVAPIELQSQFLALAKGKPVIMAVNERIFVPQPDGSTANMEFQFKKWERLLKIEIVKSDYTPFEFEYLGYHFEAVGVLPQGLEGKELINQTRGNTGLHLTAYDGLYSYEEFYKASGSPEADIFRCMETGRNYIPGVNELFGYEGEFLPYRQNE